MSKNQQIDVFNRSNNSTHSRASRLVSENMGRIYSIARWEFWNPADAMDVAQDVLAEFLAERRRGDSSEGQAQLFKVLRRVISRTRKRSARRSPHIQIDSLTDQGICPRSLRTGKDHVLAAVAHEYFHREISQALTSLSDRQRSVFWRIAVVGEAELELAKELGISRGSVHRHYWRAKIILKKELEKAGYAISEESENMLL